MPAMSLNDGATYVTAASSLALRAGSFVFLRWIPGNPISQILLSLFAIYVPSFLYNLSHTAPYKIVADEVQVVEKEVANPQIDRNDVDPRYANGNAGVAPGKELDVQETVVMEEKDPKILQSLVTGLPSPTSTLWSAATFLVNVLLMAMVWDVVYRATLFYPSHELSMARVGYVSDSSAMIMAREPDSARYPIHAWYSVTESPLGDESASETKSIHIGTAESADNSTDFTVHFEAKKLKPETRYQYEVNNHTGFFLTPPRAGYPSTRPASQGMFTFLHSSCLKNRVPYNPFSHPLSNPGLRYLSQSLTGLQAQFMLFLGDFIYADVPLQHGTTPEDYRREYRQVYASPDWPAPETNLPWLHVYDDHEVLNDWSANTTGPFPAANDPYTHYHVSANPPAARKGETYFTFTQGPATFFLLDTRRYRSPNDATNGSDPLTGAPTKTMIGATQLADVLTWLAAPPPPGVRWKILVSSVPLTRNWWFGAQDTWRGYLGERQLLLEAMWDAQSAGDGTGVIVLSGDRHEFAATAFPPPPDGVEEVVGLGVGGVGADPLGRRAEGAGAAGEVRTRTKKWPASAVVHEFSASPLNMFYLPIRTYAEGSTSAHYVSDVCVKYLPDGNSKFGAVSIENEAGVRGEQSVLRYKLFVDGVEAWRYTLTTPPVERGGVEAIWG